MAQTSVLIGAATGFAMQHEMLADFVLGSIATRSVHTENRSMSASLRTRLNCCIAARCPDGQKVSALRLPRYLEKSGAGGSIIQSGTATRLSSNFRSLK
jgi:hypothetical protein